MDHILEGLGNNLFIIIAVICYTVYEICALWAKPNRIEKYEELKLLDELREKEIISQDEFEKKKKELFCWL